MGGAVARSLLRAKFDVVVYDVRPEATRKLVDAGARAADDLDDLARQCAAIAVVVVSDAQVKDVGPKIVAAAKPGTKILIHSTVRPSTAVELAAIAAPNGIAVLDVGVNAGNAKADLGKLTLMIGGDDQAAGWWRPFFPATREPNLT